jgi:hypothetical protein
MFVVHLEGVGEGCDYTIGCNNKVVVLTDKISTLKEAVDYVSNSDSIGSLSYYGIDRIKKATIYEVSAVLDIEDIVAQKLEKRRLASAKLRKEDQESYDLSEFERLKKKLGK